MAGSVTNTIHFSFAALGWWWWGCCWSLAALVIVDGNSRYIVRYIIARAYESESQSVSIGLERPQGKWFLFHLRTRTMQIADEMEIFV